MCKPYSSGSQQLVIGFWVNVFNNLCSGHRNNDPLHEGSLLINLYLFGYLVVIQKVYIERLHLHEAIRIFTQMSKAKIYIPRLETFKISFNSTHSTFLIIVFEPLQSVSSPENSHVSFIQRGLKQMYNSQLQPR